MALSNYSLWTSQALIIPESTYSLCSKLYRTKYKIIKFFKAMFLKRLLSTSWVVSSNPSTMPRLIPRHVDSYNAGGDVCPVVTSAL
uniref:Ovule protein n=1 Tax=Steinernema glaseri TaxID=37863 RepID=A0A1I7ZFE8_9BILA